MDVWPSRVMCGAETHSDPTGATLQEVWRQWSPSVGLTINGSHIALLNMLSWWIIIYRYIALKLEEIYFNDFNKMKWWCQKIISMAQCYAFAIRANTIPLNDINARKQIMFSVRLLKDSAPFWCYLNADQRSIWVICINLARKTSVCKIMNKGIC